VQCTFLTQGQPQSVSRTPTETEPTRTDPEHEAPCMHLCHHLTECDMIHDGWQTWRSQTDRQNFKLCLFIMNQ
jgi:hypothetical protein